MLHKCRPPEIKFIRGNTYIYVPSLIFNDEVKDTVGEGENVMLSVKSPSGRTYLSKTITGTETGEAIAFTFKPTDTIALTAPFLYEYSIDLYKDNGSEVFYTLEKGVFNLQKSIGDLTDIQ